MRILTLHSDYIKFEPTKKALKTAPEVKKEAEEMKECLVVFMSVEKNDEKNPEQVVDKLVSEVDNIIKQLKTSNVVLYPYAHLSNSLANPRIAQEVLEKAELALKKKYSVKRAPFGWYKKFTVSCKGHPLAEFSREFTAETLKKTVGEDLTEEERKNMLRDISKMRIDSRKLKENDHRLLGQQLDLFSFNEVAPGMVFWHSNGLIIFNELVELWRELHRSENYSEVSTPQIMDKRLWEISGHWRLYKENMFLTKYEESDYAVKPMSCPGGMLIYRSRPHSYKELPMRVSELGKVHRLELSGTLAGLFRVIQFTQDDAHVFCTEKQLESEVTRIVKLFVGMYQMFGFKEFRFSLSTRSEEKKDKYLGSDAVWNNAIKTLSNALNKLGMNFKIEPGEAKFYGPSLDLLIKDSLGREWQCSTLQLDFNTPNRFELEYVDESDKPQTPIMLHHVVYGSVERFIGILLEHTNANLPTWLSPVQVKVINFSESNVKAVEKLVKELKESGIRAESDLSNKTVNYKVRDAEIMKVPYIIVIGDKEEENKTLAVRVKGDKKPKFGVKKEEFTKKLLEEIKNRNLKHLI
ncbi:MAG: threonine--tRNA ligase [Nanoarchaeota archaeon]|nr:threonine--tRNA ligase [Nanoarchaeota archaeon]